ncbi:MAG: hypothetical protein P4N59_27640 [Negativicutes bacterium]|nr:hypothetical protein [Negativicutes bacterium]
MSLRDVMWDLFQNTGNIGVYLLYRQCLDDRLFPPERRMPENG